MPEFYATGRQVPAANGWKWIVEGWALFARAPGVWIGIMFIFLLIMLLAFIPIVGSIASIVLSPVFSAGFVLGCRALEEGKALKVGHLFAGFRERFGTLVSVGFLYLAANLVIGLIAGLVSGAKPVAAISDSLEAVGKLAAGLVQAALAGEVSLIVLLALLVALALLIPVLMAIWFAPCLVVFQHQGAGQALRASFAGCLRNFVPFLVYGLILLVPAILASIVLGLGWLVLGPVMLASMYTSYKDIYFS
jgi:uncharacterized membrane protein